MRAHAASLKGASACSNACYSDERRTDGVFTTAVANSEENSTLGSDAMHSMLLLKKASSPGRGRWDGTPCVRVEDEGGALAPGAADATLIGGRMPLILVLPSTPFVKLLGVRHKSIPTGRPSRHVPGVTHFRSSKRERSGLTYFH